MHYYADLDDNSICTGILADADEQETGAHRIVIPAYTEAILGKRYVDGVWVEVPIPEDGPTEEDVFRAEILLNQATIIANQESMDETLAEILLGQL